MARKQIHLKFGREPLNIPYPPGFKGQKSGNYQDEEFILSVMPRSLTDDEIALAEKFIKTLPYQQQIVHTGCLFLDEQEPLMNLTHEELDRLEEENALENSSLSPGRGQRSILERVLTIRHAGYEGSGRLALSAGK